MEWDLGWSMVSPIGGSWVGAGVGTWVQAGYLQKFELGLKLESIYVQ